MALRVLVVDDEFVSRETTSRQLVLAGHVAQPAADANEALKHLISEDWNVVLTDVRMPGMDGLRFLNEVRRLRPDVDVIVMTAFGSVDTAVHAMRDGAADYLSKPFRFSDLLARLQLIEETRAPKPGPSSASAESREADVAGLVGECAEVRAAVHRIHQFAPSAAPALVTGETGTGKELVARAIHDAGPRRLHRFVALGCGAIPRDLAESLLFGHEKGAFTGAASRHIGCFEEADRGTLLLDDVDDLPLDIQVKLLRVLQEGTLRRVGGRDEVRVDVRVIATTKVDLERAVAERLFRGDLFYRLRGLEIRLPPLRERGTDVLLLAERFLAQSSDAGPPPVLAHPARDALLHYAWPGNVRELRRVIESAVAVTGDGAIELEDLPEYLRGSDATPNVFSLHLEQVERLPLQDVVRGFEEALIRWALLRAEGHLTRAAEMLGIPRTTLQSKLGKRTRDDSSADRRRIDSGPVRSGPAGT